MFDSYCTAWDCSIGIISIVFSWYLNQPESHQLSLHKVLEGMTDVHPDLKIGPPVYLGPIEIVVIRNYEVP